MTVDQKQRLQAIIDLAEARLREPLDPNTKHDLGEILRLARELHSSPTDWRGEASGRRG